MMGKREGDVVTVGIGDRIKDQRKYTKETIFKSSKKERMKDGEKEEELCAGKTKTVFHQKLAHLHQSQLWGVRGHS